MNSATASPRNAATLDKVLDKMREVSPAAPAPAEPVMRELESATPPKPRKRDSLNRTFTVADKKGTKRITTEVPLDLHAQVYLVATQRKLSGSTEPANMQDIVIVALQQYLLSNDPA